MNCLHHTKVALNWAWSSHQRAYVYHVVLIHTKMTRTPPTVASVRSSMRQSRGRPAPRMSLYEFWSFFSQMDQSALYSITVNDALSSNDKVGDMFVVIIGLLDDKLSPRVLHQRELYCKWTPRCHKWECAMSTMHSWWIRIWEEFDTLLKVQAQYAHISFGRH